MRKGTGFGKLRTWMRTGNSRTIALLAIKLRLISMPWLSSIDSDVGTDNAHSSHNELLNHLKDAATGSIGFCRAHPFPEAELWLQPRENGISCKIVIARTPESHHDVHHVFLEYAIDQNLELAVRHNGIVLNEDEVMELLLGRLVFPFGRLDTKS
ncbi:MAG: hypothetical protein ACREDR_07330 [Blastocatellia bacterium]